MCSDDKYLKQENRIEDIDTTVLLALNAHIFAKGIITKDEKEKIDMEILRVE